MPLLKRAIALARRQHPGIRIMISVGGWGAKGWEHFNPKAIARLVRRAGLDGVDLDFEPPHAKCAIEKTDQTVRCDTDEQFTKMIHGMRVAMPRPAILSLAAIGDAAYSRNGSGTLINPLKHVGGDLDLINIMAYGLFLSGDFDLKDSVSAFQKIFSGKIALDQSGWFQDALPKLSH